MPDIPDEDVPDVPAIEPAALYERISAGEAVSVLDVRNRAEHEAWPLTGPGVRTVLTPYSRFVAAEVTGGVAGLVPNLPEPVVVICPRGEASAHVAALLREEGVDAVNLAGGMRGWARLVLVREVADPGFGGSLLQYQRPSSGCLAYLVLADGEAAVVDPLRAFADRYVADARERGATLRHAVDTHVHADHVSGVREVAAATGATVVLPAGARDRGLDGTAYADVDVRFVADGDDVRVGDATLRALHAPGHTSEMTAYRVGDVLLAGDTLFLASVARPDLEVGDAGAREMARRLHRTLADRLALPPETLVAPAHFADAAGAAPDGTYTATLGSLRERLELLSLPEEAFVDRVVADMPDRPANYERIIAVNLGRESATDDDAFELELGPNNCAVAADAD
jgi:glyoxylase-like metal-dependent hydrolase (beta-lactamase superfamily II)